METIPRFFHPPAESFFLFGPRGTGKSTFMKERFPDAYHVDLLDPETVRYFSAKPERLAEIIRGQEGKKCFVIDEIQKVPELLAVIHQLIEGKQGYTFVLTGSSARKLKRTGVDMLGGRALLRTMHPFLASELGERFRLEEALQRGLLPLVFSSANPEDVLRSYAALYLREEVQMEGLVRNVGNFSRFLEAISFSHASILNLSNVARDCMVERKVVEGYRRFWKISSSASACPSLRAGRSGNSPRILNSTCSIRGFSDPCGRGGRLIFPRRWKDRPWKGCSLST